jgi:hypothetical protein
MNIQGPLSVFRRFSLGLASALVVFACDGGSEPPPPPSRTEIVAGTAQSGVVGTALTVQPSVRVLAANGRTLSQVPVTFQAGEGSGTVATATTMTDSRGVASAGIWTLGTRAGPQTLTATVSGVTPVTFTASATPAAPRSVVLVNGSGQTGPVGGALTVQPIVRVVDAFDNGVAGVTVSFALPFGGGAVQNATVITAADGTASAGVWTLGPIAGIQTLLASAAGLLSPVSLTANALATEAARLILAAQPSSTASGNTPLATQPVVQVADQFGNKVAKPGVLVTASAGNARVANAQATTDASGIATFTSLALGGSAGTYTLRFAADGLTAVDAAAAVVLGAGAATQLALVSGPPPTVNSGVPFPTQPVVEIRDADGNRVLNASAEVTATIASPVGGSVTLFGTVAATTNNGRATFANLGVNGSGSFRLGFSATGLQPVTSPDIAISATQSCTGSNALTLNYSLGQSQRFQTSDPNAPACLIFDASRNLDQQYLIMLENVPRYGGYNSGVFPGASPTSGALTFNVTSVTASGNVTSALTRQATALPPGMLHSWDFGEGPIYELQPEIPPGGAPQPKIVRGLDRISVNADEANAAVGDTLIVFLNGIQRLGIQSGNQRAVIRHISGNLIIAEDTRLATMPRQTPGPNGTQLFNTPLTQADMDAIATAYEAHAKPQADLLFGSRYNVITESQQTIVAVHTIMPADNIWGYTYMNNNVFAWDYWVTSNGSAKTLAQHPLRNAHNLFMHEIAHTRHYGWLERAQRQDLRGNMWLVEGFARFSERLPVASYLLNQTNPARTGNVVLPRYPEYGNSYYRDDVPTFLSATSSMFNGYDASSYVFDYLADHVAAAGGDWRAAVARLVTNAGTEADADAAVNSYLPGVTFQQLFTRARIALYTDDLEVPGLPLWTQYLQFQLRASRPAGSGAAIDPRNLWPTILPATPFAENRVVTVGSSFGYKLDGTGATAGARVLLGYLPAEHGVISITRIR